MTKHSLFEQLKAEYGAHLSFLKDKPEEDFETTLRACWLLASGLPSSKATTGFYDLPELNEEQIGLLSHFLKQRATQTPLAHIIGRQHFMGIEFISDDRAMIPRKETEILCRRGLQLSYEFGSSKSRAVVMDICCGAGNIGLSIAHYNRNTRVFCTDISKDAVSLAKENAEFLELSDNAVVVQGNLFEAFLNDPIADKVDIVISNPPYISSGRVDKMPDEIKNHEPVQAFDGGRFGMDIIQRLIIESPQFLKKKGWLLFEVGEGQGEFALDLCSRNDQFGIVHPILDSSGITRGVMAQRI